jgi:hypothetical protein
MPFHILWFACGVGVALTIPGFLNEPPHVLGWIGLGVTVGTAVTAIWLMRPPGNFEDDRIRLTRAMVLQRNRCYKAALKHVRRGGIVIWNVARAEELTLTPGPQNELGCSIALNRPVEQISRMKARRTLMRARASLKVLTALAPEMAAFIAIRRVDITVHSEYGSQGVVVCRELDGNIYWESEETLAESASCSEGAEPLLVA